jgi:urease accessory protein
MRWRILQLADSSFPTGGFAHSAGLEAAVHGGHARSPDDLDAFARALLWNVGHGALPFARAAHEAPEDLATIDARADAFLSSQVANRASRTQGRAFVATCAKVFDSRAIASMDDDARARTIHAHHAPLFGAVLRSLDVERVEALGLYLHVALRGVASAAIRLGLVGPHEAQRLLLRHGPTVDAVLAACRDRALADAALVAPLVDIIGATHDRLYSRLFQS